MKRCNLASVACVFAVILIMSMLFVPANKCEAYEVVSGNDSSNLASGTLGIPDVDQRLFERGMAFVQILKLNKLLDPAFISGMINIEDALGEKDYNVYKAFLEYYYAVGTNAPNISTQVFINAIVIAYNSRINQGVFLYLMAFTDIYMDSFQGLDLSKLPQIAGIYGENADQLIELIERKNITDLIIYLNEDEISFKLAPYEEYMKDLSYRI